MNFSRVCIVALCLGMLPTAGVAAEGPGVLRRISCPVVRYYVAQYSASAAEQWARSKGASDAEIEAARRCLKPDMTQAAKAPPKAPSRPPSRPLALGTYGW